MKLKQLTGPSGLPIILDADRVIAIIESAQKHYPQKRDSGTGLVDYTTYTNRSVCTIFLAGEAGTLAEGESPGFRVEGTAAEVLSTLGLSL